MKINIPNSNIEISKWINENASFVVNTINRTDVDKYLTIQSEFNKGKVSSNKKFRSYFKNFYGLNIAALGDDFEQLFFTIFDRLSDNRTTSPHLENILFELYQVKTMAGNQTVQFSFLTKMVHTIDNKKPIYDSKVRVLFEFPEAYTISEFDKKVAEYLRQYSILEYKYEDILKNNMIDKALKVFDLRFNKIEMSEEKKLDFMLWTTGKFFNSEIEYFKNRK
jgi:hypothetical protein